MTCPKLAKDLDERQINALLKLFAYSIKDIESYDELTDSEKECIDEYTFNQLAE